MSTDTPKIQYKKEVEVRVKSFGRPAARIPRNRKQNINGESEEVQKGSSHELHDWLQEFRENLVDESTSTYPWGNPEHGSQDTSKSSCELPMEPRAKMELFSGKYRVYTHFPMDPNCDICLKTKITMAFCRRRTGTVVPRAEHKVLCEEVNRGTIIDMP